MSHIAGPPKGTHTPIGETRSSLQSTPALPESAPAPPSEGNGTTARDPSPLQETPTSPSRSHSTPTSSSPTNTEAPSVQHGRHELHGAPLPPPSPSTTEVRSLHHGGPEPHGAPLPRPPVNVTHMDSFPASHPASSADVAERPSSTSTTSEDALSKDSSIINGAEHIDTPPSALADASSALVSKSAQPAAAGPISRAGLNTAAAAYEPLKEGKASVPGGGASEKGKPGLRAGARAYVPQGISVGAMQGNGTGSPRIPAQVSILAMSPCCVF